MSKTTDFIIELAEKDVIPYTCIGLSGIWMPTSNAIYYSRESTDDIFITDYYYNKFLN